MQIWIITLIAAAAVGFVIILIGFAQSFIHDWWFGTAAWYPPILDLGGFIVVCAVGMGVVSTLGYFAINFKQLFYN